MGGKLSLQQPLLSEQISDIELKITIQKPDAIVTDITKAYMVKNSNMGKFTYYKVSDKISNQIGKGFSFAILIYRQHTLSEKRIFIPDTHTADTNNNFSTKENVIDGNKYYDFIPNEHNYIILRHCSKMKLKDIIICGNIFLV